MWIPQLSVSVDKKILMLVNVNDPEDRIELTFQRHYGNIVSYRWYCTPSHTHYPESRRWDHCTDVYSSSPPPFEVRWWLHNDRLLPRILRGDLHSPPGDRPRALPGPRPQGLPEQRGHLPGFKQGCIVWGQQVNSSQTKQPSLHLFIFMVKVLESKPTCCVWQH